MTERSPMHVFEEHTGEVRLRVEAPTIATLFEQAARALCELAAGQPLPTPSEVDDERVHVRANDLGALLVDWLNELLFLSDTNKKVYPYTRVDQLGAGELCATVRGVEPGALRTAVKAATLHDLRIEKAVDCWTATVVLDV